MLIHLKNNQLPIVYLFSDLKSSLAAPAGTTSSILLLVSPWAGHLAVVSSDCICVPEQLVAICQFSLLLRGGTRRGPQGQQGMS